MASRLSWQAWTVPKDGNRAEENEDASRIERTKVDSDGLLLAMSDGASETVYAGPWARALVAAADSDWPTLSDADFVGRLDRVRAAFAPVESGQQLPWYVANKWLTQGSQATLLVATVVRAHEADGFVVRAIAVGDCCLLVFKSDGEVRTFPVHSSNELGLHPGLIPNRPQSRLAPVLRWEQSLQSGDVLLACTDAVGKWVLECLESEQRATLLRTLAELRAQGPSAPASPDDARQVMEAARGLQASGDSAEGDGEPVTSIPGELAATCDAGSLSAPRDFGQLIASCRVSEIEPRMRNDDSTLAMCAVLPFPEADDRSQAVRLLRNLAEIGDRPQAAGRP